MTLMIMTFTHPPSKVHSLDPSSLEMHMYSITVPFTVQSQIMHRYITLVSIIIGLGSMD
jgi:hypothetical protein